ncbi:hypothetical protein O181_092737 [Austropuccinia psidii MF-1]|uniref:Uncharacterized protein n=1 Tax=Austropuccinia psidii MF-1 TaxID=1389203 RepID=A0A9Q3J030_9BASI|nr:hypothetical protein [Austropuccinia psidii MF-1]
MSAEWYKLTTTNACDRIEGKFQVHDYEIEDLSISHIHEKLKILRHHVLEIVNNTNRFATHVARSDNGRQKLKGEIVANVEQIHKNYEPNSHIPRNSTPLTDKKLPLKEILTPFLGENAIWDKDIPKLEEWLAFCGEGEYSHIEFIRTIDMLQEDFIYLVK